MKKFLIFLIFILPTSSLISQIKWDKINLGNWGRIELPNSMEIQAGQYKKIMDYAKREFSLDAERVVFQQKGVNEGKNLDTYVRVIIRTDYSLQEYPNLNTEKITQQDVTELNELYKTQTIQFLKDAPFTFKLVKWNGFKILNFKGIKCLNYSYVRQLKGKPQTYSEFYIFWKGNYQHTLNVEYRINETKKWYSDIDRCVKSFVIK